MNKKKQKVMMTPAFKRLKERGEGYPPITINDLMNFRTKISPEYLASIIPTESAPTPKVTSDPMTPLLLCYSLLLMILFYMIFFFPDSSLPLAQILESCYEKYNFIGF